MTYAISALSGDFRGVALASRSDLYDPIFTRLIVAYGPAP
jgi:hypothetical protein